MLYRALAACTKCSGVLKTIASVPCDNGSFSRKSLHADSDKVNAEAKNILFIMVFILIFFRKLY
jgi:hypothetical protein